MKMTNSTVYLREIGGSWSL